MQKHPVSMTLLVKKALWQSVLHSTANDHRDQSRQIGFLLVVSHNCSSTCYLSPPQSCPIHKYVCVFHNTSDAVSTDIDASCREIFRQTKQLYPSPHFCASGREGHTWRLQQCLFFSSTCLLTKWTHISINWTKSYLIFHCVEGDNFTIDFTISPSNTVEEKERGNRLKSRVVTK